MVSRETEPLVKLGKRKCRWCRKVYKAPIGSKTAGCPDCAPRLTLDRDADPFEVLAEPEK